MSFIIATDSTGDLTGEILQELGVYSIDLTYFVNDAEYNEHSEDKLGDHDFYQAMRDGAATKTSMINESTAHGFLNELLQQGKDVLYLAFDSALSGTYANFDHVASELNKTAKNKVCVVDSLSAAGGEGLFVTLVAKKRLSGASFRETCEYAEELKQHIMHYFIVDDLKYLARGGRLSKSSAFIGNLMKIKPVLHVDPLGRLIPYKKVLGRKKSIKALLEKIEERHNGMSDIVYISHGDCPEDAQELADAIKEKLGLDVIILPLDYVIGSHSGPGTLALFFTGDSRAEN